MFGKTTSDVNTRINKIKINKNERLQCFYDKE